MSTTRNKEKKFGEFTQLDLKTYSKVTVIKTVWYWCKNKLIDQQNRLQYRPTHIHSLNYFQRCQYNLIGKEKSL